MKRWIPLGVGLTVVAAVLVAVLLTEDPVVAAVRAPVVAAPEPIVEAPPPAPKMVKFIEPVRPAVVPRLDTELPAQGLVHVDGQGFATVVPTDPAQAPSPESANPLPQSNPPIPPELPQTPEWKAEKADRTLSMLRERQHNLERLRDQARRSGDAAAIQKAEVEVTRGEQRIHKVENERDKLRSQVASTSAP